MAPAPALDLMDLVDEPGQKAPGKRSSLLPDFWQPRAKLLMTITAQSLKTAMRALDIPPMLKAAQTDRVGAGVARRGARAFQST
ncbi:hypothetical protein EMPG_15869 [Blastomyces silverae]|uniref:Uncharacterized protein n=1 Tax=Blastomyces silverae TaxID=2060906 RepID=A0A0H1BBF9_9EURO|nr:hypothetical protein EMPG_15869 [Blastomyces silverae]